MENPKSEIQNPKQTLKAKSEIQNISETRTPKSKHTFLLSNLGFRNWVLFWIVVFGFWISAQANPSKAPVKVPVPSPMEAVKELDRMADQYKVGKNLTAKDRAFNRALKARILRGTFNLRELARLALAKHWNERSEKEQDNFVELLTQLLEERSVFAKEKAAERGESRSYVIRYKKEKFLDKEKTQSFVKTDVQLKKQRTRFDLDYKLRRAPSGEWRIYDVIVDDASLVDNYRSSFGKIIQKKGYPELVLRMENKLKEFRAEKKSEKT